MSNPDPVVNIVLRSSDGVRFSVHTSLLSQASPVFRDMFSVPQPNSSLNSDASTDPIDLSESSETIRLILSLCWHTDVTSLLIDSLSHIANLLQAADKYDMKTIRKHAFNSLTQPKFLENVPLRVYAIACRYGAPDTAVLAARHTLRFPLLHAEYFPELELVDGGTIYRVLRYHKQCTAAALKVATKHTWIRHAYVFFDCSEAGSDEDEDEKVGTHTTRIGTYPSPKHKNGFLKVVSVHPWWTKFMNATKVALTESICSETIRDKDRVREALSSATQCSQCRKRVESDFSKFLDAYVNELEARVDEIKFELPGALQTNPGTEDPDD